MGAPIKNRVGCVDFYLGFPLGFPLSFYLGFPLGFRLEFSGRFNGADTEPNIVSVFAGKESVSEDVPIAGGKGATV